jgi:Ca2+-binding RTX toxin-like protein
VLNIPSGDLAKEEICLATYADMLAILYAPGGAMDNYTLLTPQDDLFYGTRKGELIVGDSGDDVIYGRRGNDFLTGCNGADILYGGAGRDVFSMVRGEATGDRFADFRPGYDMINVNTNNDAWGWGAITFDALTVEQIGRREYVVTMASDPDVLVYVDVVGTTPLSGSDFVFG